MILLDAVLRFSSLTLSVMLIILVVRDGWAHRQAKLVVALLTAAIASSIHTMPAAYGLPELVFSVALFVSVPGAALQWWFARSLLEDNFHLGVFEIIVMIVACLFKLGWSLQGIGIVPPFHDFRYFGSYTVNLLLAGHIIWIAVSGLQSDLIEQRRGVRVWFILFIAVGGLINLIMELSGFPGSFETLFIHATTLPMLIWAFVWLTSLRADQLFYAPPGVAAPKDIPPRLIAAFRRLEGVMQSETGYRDPELSVSRLAEQVGLPEHQLRRLINQSLGHRNFAAFVNGYRLAHTKRVLSDPEQAQLPVLTIAMDAGYKTLSTFNRAFRASEGKTPTDFRRQAMLKQ